MYPQWFRDAIQHHGRQDAEPAAPGALTYDAVWRWVLTEWDGKLLADLRQHYQIDLLDPDTLHRPWWWLRAHILGLFDIDSRLARWAVEAMK